MLLGVARQFRMELVLRKEWFVSKGPLTKRIVSGAGIVAFAVLGMAGHAIASGPAGSMGIPPAASIEFSDLRGVALDDLPMGAVVQVAGARLGSALRGVPEREVTLSLERFTVLNPGATVVAESNGITQSIDVSGIVLLEGSVDGEAGSRAFIGISEAGVHGFIHAAEGTYSISTGPSDPANPGEIWIGLAADVPVDGPPAPFCGFHPMDRRLTPAGAWIAPPRSGSGGGTTRTGPCRSVDIAIDTDWEYTSRLFGGNAGVSAQYAIVLLGAVGQIYKNELNVRLTTNFVRTWSSNSDPYHVGGNLLDEFSGHWGASMGAVPRELAHLLSGDYGGGVAYLSAVCEAWGYGLSGVNGWFPSPLVNRHDGNWDLMVVAHELGHNFGTGHTHDSYEPVIDGCGNGDCSAALGGTIMSYCHTCAGGMTNIDLIFGPRVRERILAYLDTRTCVLSSGGSYVAVPDTATTTSGGTVDVHVLNNDSDQSCLAPNIVSFSSVSANGGTVTMITPSPGPTQPLVRRYLRYTAPATFGGTDTFTYSITGGAIGTVTVNVLPLRPADTPSSVEPGVFVEYFVVPFRYNLPDFGTLAPYASDVLATPHFSVGDGDVLPGTGRRNEVGMVYNGYINVPASGFYTLSTASDDGSKLWIGDTLVVDNNGRHTVRTVSGQIGLAAGLHRTRIEYFEASGPASLSVRYATATLADQAIPASGWFHSPACAADVNGDTEPDILDFLDFIDSYGACDGMPAPCVGSSGVDADFNADTTVDVLDFLDFLDAFGSGC